jgi:hypothetical protein
MLMKLIRTLVPCLGTPANPDAAYLGEAVDIFDLERRMRELEART